jgi:S-adenosyl-l-methionine hydroxide adenosyltransferase/DNA methylase
MFPLQFPLAVIRRSECVRELVLDPFCGRGTTNFAARLLGIPTFGIDSSPIAIAATSAKLVHSVTPADIVSEAKSILVERRTQLDHPRGEFWRMAYRPHVLADLCTLRHELSRNCRSDARKALRGIVLGALHGPLRKDGCSSYFSNQSPRTFAPKPRYAVGFWREKGFFAPVAAMLARGEPPPGRSRRDNAHRRKDWPDDLCEIIYIDHYGNAMSGLRAIMLPRDARLVAAGRSLQRVRTFSDQPLGTAFWYENSNGLVEIAVNQGRADRELGLAIGSPIEIVE